MLVNQCDFSVHVTKTFSEPCTIIMYMVVIGVCGLYRQNGGYEQNGDMINVSPRYKNSIGVNNAPAIVDMDLMKKIPKGAQVTSVLVGEVTV